MKSPARLYEPSSEGTTYQNCVEFLEQAVIDYFESVLAVIHSESIANYSMKLNFKSV
jgi:hypothetical protein